MTEASTPQPSPSSEQLPWGISYLREDIQDLRQEMRGFDAKLETRTASIYSEIKALDAKLETRTASLHSEIKTLDAKIDGLGVHLNARIDQVYARLDGKIDTKFYWTLGTVLLTWASTILAVLFK